MNWIFCLSAPRTHIDIANPPFSNFISGNLISMMLRKAAIGFVMSRVSPRIPLGNQPLYTPRMATCSRISMVTPPAQARFCTGLSGWSLPAAWVFNKLQIDPHSHRLIVIYYYQRSSLHQLDVAVPREKDVYGYGRDNKLYIKYEGGCFQSL